MVDASQDLIYVSNYGILHGGSFLARHLDKENGKLLDVAFCQKYSNLGSQCVVERQTQAHPHAVYKWRDFVYVVDLGADKIWRYQNSTSDDDKHSGQIDSNMLASFSSYF